MVNQRPGALLDILVGIPGDAHAIQASLLNYYLNRIEEVSELETCGLQQLQLVHHTHVACLLACLWHCLLNLRDARHARAQQLRWLDMQAEYGKYLPRLRSFEKLNGPAFEQLKADWSKDPMSFARCKDAEDGIWSIYDQHCNVWVTVYLLLNYCECDSTLSVCHHQQLARHITSCGNNPANAHQDVSVELQRHAVYAAQNGSTAEAAIAVCHKAELSSLFKVCKHMFDVKGHDVLHALQTADVVHLTSCTCMSYGSLIVQETDVASCLQRLEATLADLSAPYTAATMSSLRRVCADAATAKGLVIQPPIDASIVPGRYIDVVGRQRDNRCQQAPPQGMSKRAKKVQAKRKVTRLTKKPRRADKELCSSHQPTEADA